MSHYFARLAKQSGIRPAKTPGHDIPRLLPMGQQEKNKSVNDNSPVIEQTNISDTTLENNNSNFARNHEPIDLSHKFVTDKKIACNTINTEANNNYVNNDNYSESKFITGDSLTVIETGNVLSDPSLTANHQQSGLDKSLRVNEYSQEYLNRTEPDDVNEERQQLVVMNNNDQRLPDEFPKIQSNKQSNNQPNNQPKNTVVTPQGDLTAQQTNLNKMVVEQQGYASQSNIKSNRNLLDSTKPNGETNVEFGEFSRPYNEKSTEFLTSDNNTSNNNHQQPAHRHSNNVDSSSLIESVQTQHVANTVLPSTYQKLMRQYTQAVAKNSLKPSAQATPKINITIGKVTVDVKQNNTAQKNHGVQPSSTNHSTTSHSTNMAARLQRHYLRGL